MSLAGCSDDCQAWECLARKQCSRWQDGGSAIVAGTAHTSLPQLIATNEQTIQKIRDEMKQTHRLYVEGQITPQGFGEFYKPAEERLNQLLTELPRLQADVDLMKVNRISAEDVMAEANSLYEKWPSLPLDDRRKIAEAVCEKIVIGDGEIDITLSHLPTSEELCKYQTRL